MPDAFAPALDVGGQFLLAALQEIRNVLGHQLAKADEPIRLAFPDDDLMVLKHATEHLPSDLFVILELTLVMGKNRGGNYAFLGLITMLQERHEHDRLIDIGRAYVLLDEVRKLNSRYAFPSS